MTQASRRRILLLDHDESVLITLERLLEDAGFQTTATWNAAEAISLLDTTVFDLVLVGDHPPELDAEKILRELQAHSPACPCLVLRAHSHVAEMERLFTLGALGVLNKWDHLKIVEQIRGRLRPCGVRLVPGPQAKVGEPS